MSTNTNRYLQLLTKNAEELENDLIDSDKDSGENTLNEEDETNA